MDFISEKAKDELVRQYRHLDKMMDRYSDKEDAANDAGDTEAAARYARTYCKYQQRMVGMDTVLSILGYHIRVYADSWTGEDRYSLEQGGGRIF